MSKYFTIQVTAGSKEELDKRIADNESRGFVLMKKEQVNTAWNEWKDLSDKYGTKYSARGGGVDKKYKAVMRRENRDRVAQ